jgi:hypothetical protein
MTEVGLELTHHGFLACECPKARTGVERHDGDFLDVQLVFSISSQANTVVELLYLNMTYGYDARVGDWNDLLGKVSKNGIKQNAQNLP